jgi:hypothetical protein
MPPNFPRSEALKTLLEGLAFDIWRETQYPSRPVLRRRLERIRDAGRPGRRPGAREFLRRELADPRIAALLDVETPNPPKGLRERVERVLARTPTRGRGKLYPDVANGPDALEHCALIVMMLWRRDTGRLPGQWRSAAHKLCEQLWQAAGGEPHGGPAAKDGSLGAWRRHLAAAKRYLPPHQAGKFVERILDPPPPPERPRRAAPPNWYDHPSPQRVRPEIDLKIMT